MRDVAVAQKCLLIVNLCHSIDKRTSDIYRRWSAEAPKDELREFWADMAAEEQCHVTYWEKLQDWAQKGKLKGVFRKPNKLQATLQDISQRFADLEVRSRRARRPRERFMLAYELEFYLMNQALASALCLLDPFCGDGKPIQAYDRHIVMLIRTCNEHCRPTTSLKLLGDTLYSLWEERIHHACKHAAG